MGINTKICNTFWVAKGNLRKEYSKKGLTVVFAAKTYRVMPWLVLG